MTPDLSDFSSFPTSKLSIPSVVCGTWEAVLIRSDARSYDVVLRRASGGGGCRGEMSWLGVADGFDGYSDSCFYLVRCLAMNVILAVVLRCISRMELINPGNSIRASNSLPPRVSFAFEP